MLAFIDIVSILKKNAVQLPQKLTASFLKLAELMLMLLTIFLNDLVSLLFVFREQFKNLFNHYPLEVRRYFVHSQRQIINLLRRQYNFK